MITVLAIELSRGEISYQDPIRKFVPQLNESYYKDVTIGALASHTSGLGRDGYEGEAFLYRHDTLRQEMGLPERNSTIPKCVKNSWDQGNNVCSKDVALAMFNNPAYAPRSPNSEPMYSNIAFILLGMALEDVHKKPYKQIIQDLILDPVGMTHSTFESPDNRSAVLPLLSEEILWRAGDIGFFNPTGGLWSTPDDMLALLQALLSNKLLTKAETRAWLQPRAFTSSVYRTVGLPWETIRPDDFNVTYRRPITIPLKEGGVPGYMAWAVLIPEYNLALTVHGAGSRVATVTDPALEIALKQIVPYVDQLARQQARQKYVGCNQDNLGHKVNLFVDDGPGIVLEGNLLSELGEDIRLYPTEPDTLGTSQEVFSLVGAGLIGSGWNGLGCFPFVSDDGGRYQGKSLQKVIIGMGSDGAVSIQFPAWGFTLMRQL